MVLQVLTGVVVLAQESSQSLMDSQRQPAHKTASLKAHTLIEDAAVAPRLRGSQLEYRYTGKSPYNSAIPVEVYRSGRLQVEMNALDGSVIQFGPEPTDDVAIDPSTIADFTPRFGWRELLQIAQQFVNKASPSLDPATLQSQIDDKEGLVFFFRWSNPTSGLEEGVRPFVQVGITVGGDIVSYTNTLDLPSIADAPNHVDSRTLASSSRQASLLGNLGLSGTYIFANGGNYYSEAYFSAWNTTWNAGYCGHIKPCAGNPPTSMRWSYETDYLSQFHSAATWTHPYTSQYAQHFVFVPSVNATSRSAYYVLSLIDGTSRVFTINQMLYYDAFVSTGVYRGVISTQVGDGMPGSIRATPGRKVGVDEIRIIY
jgi:hypothetical protein